MWDEKEIKVGAITTGAERQLAVRHWLLSAADDIAAARNDWAARGVTMLRCGTLFSAVRIPAETVHAAFRTDDATATDTYLGAALQGGPVLVDTARERYYALVPASTCRSWNVLGSECLGRDSYLGVPRPDVTRDIVGMTRSYWSVPMDSPGMLCAPGAVSQLIAYGRYRLCAAELAQS